MLIVIDYNNIDRVSAVHNSRLSFLGNHEWCAFYSQFNLWSLEFKLNKHTKHSNIYVKQLTMCINRRARALIIINSKNCMSIVISCLLECNTWISIKCCVNIKAPIKIYSVVDQWVLITSKRCVHRV